MAVDHVLTSGKVNYWTGQVCREFEKEFAQFADCGHAVSLANGTVALDLALKGLGIGPGDEVIVTPRSFIASVSSVVNAGAIPIFADVERDSGNISPESIATCISPSTKAIIPVHLGGWPCDMPAIMDMARSYGLSVIEDCAQAHGARIGGRSVGSFGEIGAWSFCQDKIMTTGGEGGMVTTSDSDLWQTMWEYKDHGKSWSKIYEQEHSPGFRWLHHSFGTNWRMLEIQAAIGRIQIEHMPVWHSRRTQIALNWLRLAREFPKLLRAPAPADGVEHAWYRYYAYLQPHSFADGWDRDRVIAQATARGVPLFHGTCSEIYRETALERAGLQPTRPLTVAHELGETSLMFLTHPTITDEQLSKGTQILREIFFQAQG